METPNSHPACLGRSHPYLGGQTLKIPDSPSHQLMVEQWVVPLKNGPIEPQGLALPQDSYRCANPLQGYLDIHLEREYLKTTR